MRTCGGYEFFEVYDCICLFQTLGNKFIEFSFRVEEIVVRVHDNNGCFGRHCDWSSEELGNQCSKAYSKGVEECAEIWRMIGTEICLLYTCKSHILTIQSLNLPKLRSTSQLKRHHILTE